MNPDYPKANDPSLMYEGASDTVYTDMSAVEPVEHRHDHIVGNELRCSLHVNCTVIFVKPTEVLEKGADGNLHLVDKAVA